MRPRSPRPPPLVQYDCHDWCAPHALCLEHRALTCPHTVALLARGDWRAAIRALPPCEPAQPAIHLAAPVVVGVPTGGPAEAVYLVTAWHTQLSPWTSSSRWIWSGLS